MRNLQQISRSLLTISSFSSRHLESDICITIAVLFGIMMVLTLFYSFISRCFNNSTAAGEGRDNDHRTRELRPCSELDNAAPVITFDLSSSTPFDGDSCAICLSEFENGDTIRVLPCKHVYHVECIDKWVPSRSSRCPVCRVKVVKKCGEKPVVTNCRNAMQVINFGPIQHHNYL